MLHKAAADLGTDQQEIEAKVETYRRSLLTYAYEEALVGQKLDTTVADAEVDRYYTENQKNFLLKDNIVRVRWFKLREEDKRILKKIEQWWRSGRRRTNTSWRSGWPGTAWPWSTAGINGCLSLNFFNRCPCKWTTPPIGSPVTIR